MNGLPSTGLGVAREMVVLRGSVADDGEWHSRQL